jgi:Domain of unknown function (DUF4833)
LLRFTTLGFTALGFTALGFTALGFTKQAAAQSGRTLFVVRRSANRNTVYFEWPASVTDPNQPLNVYWRLFQGDGRVEPLTFLERQLAYGYEVTERKNNVVQLTFTASRDRPVEIHLGATPKAILKIAGEPSVLREVFVTAEETGLIPRIKYVDLVGVAVSTGRPRRERIPV